VPDHLIHMLREYLETLNATKGSKLSERFQLGDFVTIRGGPFAGYEGIFNAHLPGRDRVEVLLNLLQGPQIRVQLPVEQLALNSSSLGNRI
jgi:transcriptional antiterminator RfaH